MKPGTPALPSVRLLDPLRERVRHLHYSLSTAKICLEWARFGGGSVSPLNAWITTQSIANYVHLTGARARFHS
jgi:hypothetical protein